MAELTVNAKHHGHFEEIFFTLLPLFYCELYFE